MANILFIMYMIILIILIITFIRCLKIKSKWKFLFIFEIFSIILSAILLIYYNTMSNELHLGDIVTTDLSHIIEVAVSLFALIVYSIISLITLMTKLIIYFSEKTKKKNPTT